MSKSNFLLVDLNEPKTKKLAETITSETSRKILNHLVEKEETEANIAATTGTPISTVHYHLQKLQEAGLVKVEEFHYSSKGREVNHYRLANKYIIIAPRKIEGLREKLKGILPVAGLVLGISALIKIVQNYTLKSTALLKEEAMAAGMAKVTDSYVESAAAEAAPTLAREAAIVTQQPDIAWWFLAGGVVSLVIYISFTVLRKWWKER